MATYCPHCGDDSVKRTAADAVTNEYRCKACGGGFVNLSSAARRVVVFSMMTILKLGLDGGALGALAASAVSSDDT